MVQSTAKFHAIEKIMKIADLLRPFTGFTAEYVSEYINIKSLCSSLREIADILEKEIL